MKHLSIFIRSAVLATAMMLLVPTAADAWSGIEMLNSSGESIATTESTTDQDGFCIAVADDYVAANLSEGYFYFYFHVLGNDNVNVDGTIFSGPYIVPYSWDATEYKANTSEMKISNCFGTTAASGTDQEWGISDYDSSADYYYIYVNLHQHTLSIASGTSTSTSFPVTYLEVTSGDSDTDTDDNDSSSITIYVSSSSSEYYMYLWTVDSGSKTEYTGDWPGTQFSDLSTTTVDGTTYYYKTVTGVSSVNVIFNEGNSGNQTVDITGITENTYFVYNGGVGYTFAKSETEYTYNIYVALSGDLTTSTAYGYIYDASHTESSAYNGAWESDALSNTGWTTVTEGSTSYYKFTVTSTEQVYLILHSSTGQTETIGLAEGDNYFTYSGGTSYNDDDASTGGFWFYSPDIFSSVNDCLGSTYYKFSKERVREGGALLDNFVSFNVQEFILNKAAGTGSGTSDTKSLSFYILYYDGTTPTFYGPQSSTTIDIRACSTSDHDAWLGQGAQVYQYENMAEVGSDGTSFTLTLYGEGYTSSVGYNHESFTFFVNKEESTCDLRVVANKSYFGVGENPESGTDTLGIYDADGYYLVGNFSSSTTDNNINPFNGGNKKTLTKYYYYNGGNYSTSAPTSYDVDSIVYKTTVAAPSEGFSGLYLVAFPKSYLDDFTGHTDVSSGVTYTYSELDTETYDKFNSFCNSSNRFVSKAEIWMRAIRPQEWYRYTTPSRNPTGGYDGLDATALHGGLFSRNQTYPSYDVQQAFNPSSLSDVTALVFSMNVTTSTYNITLFKESEANLYIAGPAVLTDGSTSTEWISVKFGTDSDAGSIQLTRDDDGVYKYLDDNGDEKTITMKSGHEFCFVRGSGGSWMDCHVFQEDEVTPVDLSGSSDSNNEVSAYANATSAGDYAETQYVNIMEVNTEGLGQTDYSSDKVSPMTFNLPGGNYYVRLYWGFDATGNLSGAYSGVTKTYYTVSPRSYTFYRPDANTIAGLTDDSGNSYDAFKAFCDYFAVVLPDSIDAFYVNEVSDEDAETTDGATASGVAGLQKVTFSGDDRVLPANTPVYLAIAHGDDATAGWKIPSTAIEYYDHPWYTDESLTSGNMLVGQITKATIPQKSTSDGTTSYNYMLGYKKLTSGNNAKPTWGFYVPSQSSSCAINSVYLSTTAVESVSASSGETDESIFIALTFGDITDGDSETTAIEAVDGVQTIEGDGAYYTLQGFKLAARPAMKGIYIHNGKKVVIK